MHLNRSWIRHVMKEIYWTNGWCTSISLFALVFTAPIVIQNIINFFSTEEILFRLNLKQNIIPEPLIRYIISRNFYFILIYIEDALNFHDLKLYSFHFLQSFYNEVRFFIQIWFRSKKKIEMRKEMFEFSSCQKHQISMMSEYYARLDT